MAGPVKTYEQVHAGLFWFAGKAADHLCCWCLEPAKHWCYLYTAGLTEIIDERGRRYSEGFSDYAPMCWSCHKKFDLVHDPRLLETAVENVRRGRLQVTPEQRSFAGQQSMKVRRQCGECDLVSSPAGIGRHQKFSQHAGHRQSDTTTGRR